MDKRSFGLGRKELQSEHLVLLFSTALELTKPDVQIVVQPTKPDVQIVVQPTKPGVELLFNP